MKNRSLLLISLFFAIGVGTGCQRSTDDVWNDTKTAGRHMGRGVSALGGKQGTSRQITDGVEFGDNAPMAVTKGHNEFTPFGGEDQGDLFAVGDAEVIPAPKDTPGDIGSPIPGIEGFRDPALDPELAPIFEHLHFDLSFPKGANRIEIPPVRSLFSKPFRSFFGECNQAHPYAIYYSTC